MSISYRNDFGLWWPEWDRKAEKNFKYITKHLPTMDFAISQCKERRLCIQAGGHVGIWPIKLSEFFEQVATFEPEPDLFECLLKNVFFNSKVVIQETALSNSNRIGNLHRSTSSGSNSIEQNGAIKIDLITLDALYMEACDAIFLDVEGHELEALQGAEQTILKHRPVIQVEELDDGATVKDYLTTLGYHQHPVKQGKDRVYLP